MTDYALSLIRTYVPIAVGAVLSWLLTLGIEVDESVRTAAVVALTGVLQAAYYTAARWLEQRFVWARHLLGSSTTPTYGKHAQKG